MKIACAVMTMMGIYGCDTNPLIQTPGSACYRIVAISAPVEWILSLCFVNYLAAMAYVLWHAESIRADMLRCQKAQVAEGQYSEASSHGKIRYSMR
jgi:hypothetical protein